MRLDKLAVHQLDKEYSEAVNNNGLLENLKKALQSDIKLHQNHLSSIEMCTNRQNDMEEYHKVMLDIFALQRKELFTMKREKLFSDDEIRKAESQLDLNELKITGNKHL